MCNKYFQSSYTTFFSQFLLFFLLVMVYKIKTDRSIKIFQVQEMLGIVSWKHVDAIYYIVLMLRYLIVSSIVKKSYDTSSRGVLADISKKARVKILLKIGNKHKEGNYRPVLVLPTFSRTLKILFCNHL